MKRLLVFAVIFVIIMTGCSRSSDKFYNSYNNIRFHILNIKEELNEADITFLNEDIDEIYYSNEKMEDEYAKSRLGVTRIIMVAVILFGSTAIVYYIGFVFYNGLLFLRKKEQREIWPPFISNFKMTMKNDGEIRVGRIMLNTFMFFTFCIALIYWVEEIIKAIFT